MTPEFKALLEVHNLTEKSRTHFDPDGPWIQGTIGTVVAWRGETGGGRWSKMQGWKDFPGLPINKKSEINAFIIAKEDQGLTVEPFSYPSEEARDEKLVGWGLDPTMPSE